MKKTVGRLSTFGGSSDRGVAAHEGLALIQFNQAQSALVGRLFKHPFDLALGLARNLDTRAFYCAMRWDYKATPADTLLRSQVAVKSAFGRVVWCTPADWGPNVNTGRVIDLSPAAAAALEVETDDVVSCYLFTPADLSL